MTDSDKDKDLANDPFHRHEVLHMSSVIQSLFQTEICENEFVKSEPDLGKLAEEINNKIAELYQLLGSAVSYK